MLQDRIYYKNYRLFKIPFSLLLAYHCPIGNTIKFWTSHLMIAHILGVRNDLHILNLNFTLLQMRKALNVVFSASLGRRSLLIYAQYNKSLYVEHEAVYTFVNNWLPGLISNYRQLVRSIHRNAKALHHFGSVYLSRPQLDALAATSNRSKLLPLRLRRYLNSKKYAKIPNISLSVLDSPIWLNECESIAIPSIQLCDTQSNYDSITYPIIANQRSAPFTRLVINLFSETCAYALMTDHFYVTRLRLTKADLRFMVPSKLGVKRNKRIQLKNLQKKTAKVKPPISFKRNKYHFKKYRYNKRKHKYKQRFKATQPRGLKKKRKPYLPERSVQFYKHLARIKTLKIKTTGSIKDRLFHFISLRQRNRTKLIKTFMRKKSHRELLNPRRLKKSVSLLLNKRIKRARVLLKKRHNIKWKTLYSKYLKKRSKRNVIMLYMIKTRQRIRHMKKFNGFSEKYSRRLLRRRRRQNKLRKRRSRWARRLNVSIKLKRKFTFPFRHRIKRYKRRVGTAKRVHTTFRRYLKYFRYFRAPVGYFRKMRFKYIKLRIKAKYILSLYRRIKRLRLRKRNYTITSEYTADQEKRRIFNESARSRFYHREKHARRIIFNKNTYIINRHKFAYKIRDHFRKRNI